MGKLSSSAFVETTTWSQYIPEETIREWQDIVELIVRLSGARSGLVMRVIEDSIQVCVSSKTENNPYRVGDSARLIDSDLYCERAIATQKPLLVPNALQSVEWRNNPDIEFNMISYLGVPIRWPCGKPFGTICVLDDKENAYSSDLLVLLEKMRNLIEHHLQLKQARDVAEAANRALQSANAELDQRATTDSLTGAYNRRYFEQAAVAGIARAQRYDEPLSLLLCDIDHFKAVNDNQGHQAGDKVLIEMTRLMQDYPREVDLMARWGGEEFVVLLPHCEAAEAVMVAEKLRALVSDRPFPEVGGITVSFGVVQLRPNENLDDSLKRVDHVLYAAKASGRDCVRLAQ